MTEENDIPKCKVCGKDLTYCPYCLGEDSYGGQAQGPDGYWICEDKQCEEYQLCCGC